MRSALILFLMLGLVGFATAQEYEVLTLMWEENIVPAAGEKVQVIEHYVGDINFDGYEESVTATSGKAGTRNLKYKNQVSVFGRNGSILWQYSIDDVVRDMVIYDLNNDGKMELIVSSGQVLGTPEFHRGTVRIIDSTGDLKRSYDSTLVLNNMFVDDIDGDRYYEIVGGSSGRIYLFHSYGEGIWYHPHKNAGLLNKSADAVCISDIDGNGVGDVIAGADMIYYLNAKGSLMGVVDAEPEVHMLKKGFKHIEVADLTGGSYPDTLAVTETNKVVAVGIDTAIYLASNEGGIVEGSVRWSTDLGCNINDVQTHNIDADDFSEIIIACSDNKVYALDNNGWIMWEYPLNGEPMDIYIKDVDDDQSEDILVAVSSGYVYLLDGSGNFKWRHNTNSTSLVKVAAGDINGDRTSEVVVVTDSATVKGYSLNKTYSQYRRADTLFNLGQQAYISSEYKSAVGYFKQAKEMYLRLGYEKGVMDSQSFISKTEEKIRDDRREEAAILYSKAQEYYFSGDFTSSQTLAERAKTLYSEFGNTEGVVKCDLLLMQIERQQTDGPPPTLPKSTTTTTLSKNLLPFEMKYVTSALILVLLFTVIILLKKRRESPEMIDDSLQLSKDSWEKDMMDIESETTHDGD